MILLFLALTFIGLPLILGLISYKMFYSSNKTTKIFSSIPIIALTVLLFSLYTALYPLDSFYEENWEKHTKIKLPETTNIVWKSATYPDIHGDYTAHAIMEFSEDDFKKIVQLIKSNTNIEDDKLRNNPIYGFLDPAYLPTEWQNEKSFLIIYDVKTHGCCFKIGIGRDGKTIVFERFSV